MLYPNLNDWMERYEYELVKHRAENPGKYLWADDQLQDIVDRMRECFVRGPGHYNKNSHSIRLACKHFGIPHTFTAINKFIRGEK